MGANPWQDSRVASGGRLRDRNACPSRLRNRLCICRGRFLCIKAASSFTPDRGIPRRRGDRFSRRRLGDWYGTKRRRKMVAKRVRALGILISVRENSCDRIVRGSDPNRVSTPALAKFLPNISFPYTYCFHNFAGYFYKLSTLVSVDKSDKNAGGPVRVTASCSDFGVTCHDVRKSCP